MYRHPSPFSTNIYWRDEMALGPGPPQKRRGGKDSKGNQRQLVTAGTESSKDSNDGCSKGPSRGGGPSLETAGHGVRHWYRQHYQREDEYLWGNSFDQTAGGTGRRRSGVRGSSVGLTGIGCPGTASSEPYYYSRSPPLTELHPPVVNVHPMNAEAMMWMLQPPPSAKIMNGKSLASRGRSRTDSGKSRNAGDVCVQKARPVRSKTEPSRIKRHVDPASKGDLPPASKEWHESNMEAAASMQGPEDIAWSRHTKRIGRPPPIWISEDSNAEDTVIILEKTPSPFTTQFPLLVQAPSLVDATSNSKHPIPADRPVPAALSNSKTAPSLKVLQELLAPNGNIPRSRSSDPLS